jgi:hypothetical protein
MPIHSHRDLVQTAASFLHRKWIRARHDVCLKSSNQAIEEERCD